MARNELAVLRKTRNGLQDPPANAGVVPTADGHYIDTNTRTGVRDQVQLEDVVLHVTVATAPSTLTVQAGDDPVAVVRDQGPLSFNLPVGYHEIGPFESMRLIKNSGRLFVDYGTPANVRVWASSYPRGDV